MRTRLGVAVLATLVALQLAFMGLVISFMAEIIDQPRSDRLSNILEQFIVTFFAAANLLACRSVRSLARRARSLHPSEASEANAADMEASAAANGDDIGRIMMVASADDDTDPTTGQGAAPADKYRPGSPPTTTASFSHRSPAAATSTAAGTEAPAPAPASTAAVAHEDATAPGRTLIAAPPPATAVAAAISATNAAVLASDLLASAASTPTRPSAANRQSSPGIRALSAAAAAQHEHSRTETPVIPHENSHPDPCCGWGFAAAEAELERDKDNGPTGREGRDPASAPRPRPAGPRSAPAPVEDDDAGCLPPSSGRPAWPEGVSTVSPADAAGDGPLLARRESAAATLGWAACAACDGPAAVGLGSASSDPEPGRARADFAASDARGGGGGGGGTEGGGGDGGELELIPHRPPAPVVHQTSANPPLAQLQPPQPPTPPGQAAPAHEVLQRSLRLRPLPRGVEDDDGGGGKGPGQEG